MLRELDSRDIDRLKWDAVVSADATHKVYAMSWFLDAVTENKWRAFVFGDYLTVMPFVVKRKYGISYCYMPMFAQQFSIYGFYEHANEFISALREKYQYAEFCISDNKFISQEGLEKREKTNFILSLSKDYRQLYLNYTKKHQASLTKYSNELLSYEQAHDITPLLDIFREEKKEIYSFNQMNELLENIRKIYNASSKNGLSKLYQVKERGLVIGGAFFLIDNYRIYYFFGTSKKQSTKPNGISFILLDRLIKEYAESVFTLDFEGSDNPGIAHFFKGFGAMREPYTMIKWNDLPFFIKWIKR